MFGKQTNDEVTKCYLILQGSGNIFYSTLDNLAFKSICHKAEL